MKLGGSIVLTHYFSIFRDIWPVYRRFFQYCREDRRFIWLCGTLLVGIATTNTIMIWYIGAPLNLIQKGNFQDIPKILLYFGLLVLINQGLHFAATTLSGWLQLQFVGRVRKALLVHCMEVSFPVIDQHAKGDILARFSSELDRVAQFILQTLFSLVSHSLIFIFYASMLAWINIWLALLALACSPLFLVHQYFFGRRKQIYSREFFAAGGKLLAFEAEFLSNLRGIGSFKIEKQVLLRHQHIFTIAKNWAMKNKWLDALFETSVNALIYLGALLIVMVGLWQLRDGNITIGAFVSFILFLGYLSVPIRGAMQLALQCQEDKAAAVRIAEILDTQPYVKEATDAKPLLNVKGCIKFENVSFSYPTGELVLHNVSFATNAGETIALVGPSGSGKSTFTKLLTRFYDPQAGTIYIDTQDLKLFSLESLRNNIAVVWQHPFLINDSLSANLLLARSDASKNDIIDACQAAHAWEFIETLPQGLDTLIGANGVELSAGQQQRIAIAQAFLKDAPLLIMDEASSALDSHAEKLITNAIDRLRKDRSTLIIAHRFSAIRTANRIIFFNGDGTVILGTHSELWEKNTAYRSAVEWQQSKEK